MSTEPRCPAGTEQVELSSEHEKNCRTYVCFMCRTNRRGSITWLGEALSCRASLASEPKLQPFCCSLGVRCSGEGGGGGRSRSRRRCGARAHEVSERPLKEMWSWATGRLQRHFFRLENHCRW